MLTPPSQRIDDGFMSSIPAPNPVAFPRRAFTRRRVVDQMRVTTTSCR
jgi:hypothetical protein